MLVSEHFALGIFVILCFDSMYALDRQGGLGVDWLVNLGWIGGGLGWIGVDWCCFCCHCIIVIVVVLGF